MFKNSPNLLLDFSDQEKLAFNYILTDIAFKTFIKHGKNRFVICIEIRMINLRISGITEYFTASQSAKEFYGNNNNNNNKIVYSRSCLHFVTFVGFTVIILRIGCSIRPACLFSLGIGTPNNL